MKLRWIMSSQDNALSKELSRQLRIHPITAQVLINRGIRTKEDAEKFLSPKLNHLPDPYLFKDMDKAVDRIVRAINGGEKIAIFGDYDADGVTSTALMVRFFRAYGISVDYYIPNRLSEGYGLSVKGIDEIKGRGAALIITTDNGTNCHSEIEHANSKGIDVIVTDHHEISENLPPAFAVINPKRGGANAVFEELAGVGVAFYLTIALRSRLREVAPFKSSEPDLRSLLDLVAIGTVADVAPLTGINRILVKNGIEILKKTLNTGLHALNKASATDPDRIDAYSIAFRLAPRINAAGRLGRQNEGLSLLLTEDFNEANITAERLNRMNSERQSLEKNILKEVSQIVDRDIGTSSSIVLWSDQWHPGVIGIVASRLSEAHRKPCAMISVEDGIGRGSVRTVGNFNIMDALHSCAHTLKNYGGHRGAAGFDIDANEIKVFSGLFEKHTLANLSDEDRIPNIELDMEIDISEINAKLIGEIESLAPFGEGNPEPLFITTACHADDARTVGTNHLKLKIRDDRSTLDAIGFTLGEMKLDPNEKYRFAGIPHLNEWNGRNITQFKIKDIEPA